MVERKEAICELTCVVSSLCKWSFLGFASVSKFVVVMQSRSFKFFSRDKRESKQGTNVERSEFSITVTVEFSIRERVFFPGDLLPIPIRVFLGHDCDCERTRSRFTIRMLQFRIPTIHSILNLSKLTIQSNNP